MPTSKRRAPWNFVGDPTIVGRAGDVPVTGTDIRVGLTLEPAVSGVGGHSRCAGWGGAERDRAYGLDMQQLQGYSSRVKYSRGGGVSLI